MLFKFSYSSLYELLCAFLVDYGYIIVCALLRFINNTERNIEARFGPVREVFEYDLQVIFQDLIYAKKRNVCLDL